MEIREACPPDAEALNSVLEALFAAGKRKMRGGADFVLSNYIAHPERVRCSVAVAGDGTLLGFQSLRLAHEGNPYGTPIDWGIIGTHIHPSAARRGIGARLFVATLAAARAADLPQIEAYIARENEAALAYYEAMGFRTWRGSEGIICKALKLEG